MPRDAGGRGSVPAVAAAVFLVVVVVFVAVLGGFVGTDDELDDAREGGALFALSASSSSLLDNAESSDKALSLSSSSSVELWLWS